VIGDHALQGCKGIKRLNCRIGNAEYGIDTPNSEPQIPNSSHPSPPPTGERKNNRCLLPTGERENNKSPLPTGERKTNKSPRPSGERVGVRGVTLIEVILVIVIVGILVAIVVPKTNITIPSETSVNGAAYMIASDIRYTQECAMANRVSKSVSFVAGQNFYTFPATVPSTSGLDPSGRLISGVTTGTTITFTFNSLGEPIAGGGNSVTVSDGATTKTITVLQYTGKVNIS
jgi:prepilin-type N-terminal cleavage/methylation domain-containing protein